MDGMVEALQSNLATAIWYEAVLRGGAEPHDLYGDIADAFDGELRAGHIVMHHFWDEPWAPRRFVLRIMAGPEIEAQVGDWLSAHPGIERAGPWRGVDDDRELYGDWFVHVVSFFQASSLLAGASDYRRDAKLVHCFLNARQMDPLDEAKFAFRFGWNRLTIALRWRLYLRRRWLKANPEYRGVV